MDGYKCQQIRYLIVFNRILYLKYGTLFNSVAWSLRAVYRGVINVYKYLQ